jgi:hypothetical protein
VPNEEPNSGKREQVDAQWQGAWRWDTERQVRKHLIELSEHGEEFYDAQGSPKPFDHVRFVVRHFEHVQELSEVFDPYDQ